MTLDSYRIQTTLYGLHRQMNNLKEQWQIMG